MEGAQAAIQTSLALELHRFGLGYAPNDGQALYQFLRDKGYNQQELDASGLFKRSASGRIYWLRNSSSERSVAFWPASSES